MRQPLTIDQQRAVVEANIRAYAKVAHRYDRKHDEIFNPVEQARLRESLERAAAHIRSDGRRALDLGSGTGNVTAHLLDLGFDVTAADVSPDLLEMVGSRFPQVTTLRVDGLGLAGIADKEFDLVAAYSVLHHVPEYLPMLDEAVRVTRPGGVIYLDHERNDAYWEKAQPLLDFRAALDEHARSQPGRWNPARRRWQRFLMPSKYVFRAKLRWKPELIFDEGDIHGFEGDHVEWSEVEERLERAGAEVIERRDYLNYESSYPMDVYERHRDKASDMRWLIARRTGG